jgi:hypothetical protein
MEGMWSSSAAIAPAMLFSSVRNRRISAFFADNFNSHCAARGSEEKEGGEGWGGVEGRGGAVSTLEKECTTGNTAHNTHTIDIYK